MTVSESHARIKMRVWQTIAQGDIDVSSIPKETLEALIDTVTTTALLDVDDQIGTTLASESKLSESDAEVDAELDDITEDILWEGRPLLSVSTRYIVTDERVRIIEGILGKSRHDIELIRIQDIKQTQTLGERLLNVGDLTILSHDRNQPKVTLHNVKDPVAVHELLRRGVLRARKKYGLSYREEM